MVGLGGGRGRGDGGVGSDKKEGPPDLYGGGMESPPLLPSNTFQLPVQPLGRGTLRAVWAGKGPLAGEYVIGTRGIFDLLELSWVMSSNSPLRLKINPFRFISVVWGHRESQQP